MKTWNYMFFLTQSTKLKKYFLKKLQHFQVLLTRAPLLRRIIKTMKVSNQLCSTILKHVFLRFHHCFPLPSSTLTWQHLNLRTQPCKSICVKKKKDLVEFHNRSLCILSANTTFPDAVLFSEKSVHFHIVDLFLLQSNKI